MHTEGTRNSENIERFDVTCTWLQ